MVASTAFLFCSMVNDKNQEVSMYDLYLDMEDSPLEVKAVNLTVDELQPSYLIHFSKNGLNYFGYFKEFKGNSIIIKSGDGNEVEASKQAFTNQAIVINCSKNYTELRPGELKVTKGRLIFE
jgi:hypothetical protein